MAVSGLRQRPQPWTKVREPNLTAVITNPALDPKIGHPSGEAKYGRLRALFRAFTVSLYFGTGIIMYESSDGGF